jgi:GT2 family glycosyltransferase
VGVRQLTSDGDVFPTIRRFPTAVRALFEALGSERLPIRANWLGERELDSVVYDQDVECDWTSGSFMLARGEALRVTGGFDERFFLYCEETDLCLRIKQSGWTVRHLPTMTIIHHVNATSPSPRMYAQAAHAKKQYFEKHFARPHRLAANLALTFGYALRSVVGSGGADGRASSRVALATLVGLREPPFEDAASRALASGPGP